MPWHHIGNCKKSAPPHPRILESRAGHPICLSAFGRNWRRKVFGSPSVLLCGHPEALIKSH